MDYSTSRQKLNEVLTSKNVISSIEDEMDFLLAIIPEIKSMIGFNQNHPHHHLDVWQHTLLAMSMSSNNFGIRLALLLHDIAKPHCYQDAEVRHFKGHAEHSSEMARRILRRMGFEKTFTDEIVKLVKLHDTPLDDKAIESDPDFAEKLFEIQTCDALSHHPDHLEKRKMYLVKTKNKIDQIKKAKPE